MLNKRHVILLNYFFLPFLIVDAWFQHFINIFNNKRIIIYDRFYQDIIINFQNSFTRKIISKILPKSKYTLYLYANPLTNFNRKKQEFQIEKLISDLNKISKFMIINFNHLFLNRRNILFVICKFLEIDFDQRMLKPHLINNALKINLFTIVR